MNATIICRRPAMPIVLLMAIMCRISSAQDNYQIIASNYLGGTTAPLTLRKGNLYGVGLDYVWELSPGTGGTWNDKLLAKTAFGTNALVFDPGGNIYGTTVGSRTACDCGTVFQLTPNADGNWTEHTLHNFTGGYDGSVPYGGLVMDQAGNLYGTASQGGSGFHGVAFEFTPNGDGTWTENILHSFKGGSDGGGPLGTLTFHNGILYGTTPTKVFSLKRSRDSTWIETVLYTFKGGSDAIGTFAGVIFDREGNLYGTTRYGGNHGCYNNQGCGTVFQLRPTENGLWSETVIYRFRGGSDGADPYFEGVVHDRAGNLYGTTVLGGDNPGCIGGDCGTVFELKPGANNKWTETVLHRFGNIGDDGTQPAGVILNSSGDLFGGSAFGGSYNAGIVFEITP